MSSTSDQTADHLLPALGEWAARNGPSLAERGIEIVFTLGEDRRAGAAWIQAEAQHRLAELILHSTGQVDLQVIRRKDEFFVVNEHRRIFEATQLDDLLQLLVLAIAFVDPD